MLVRLSIRDIVLIERLDIDFSPGLAALTGETGAGKSILLDAVALVLGARGDAGLVRQGAEQGQVTAAFEPPSGHPVHEIMAAHGITAENELILRRVQFADGRTRGFVNDQPVSAQALKALGRSLVELHGQHDERALVDAATHRQLLDAFGGLEGQVQEAARLWEARRARVADVAAQRVTVERARREADFLRHATEELGRLAPSPSEEALLADKRAAMMQAEKIAGDLRDAHDAVAGAVSPIAALSAAVRRLERRTTQAPQLIEPVMKALVGALAALDEVRAQLDAALRTADNDPRELERIEERLFALRTAARKYNVPVDALSALGARYGAELGRIDAGMERLADLEAGARELDEAYRTAAEELSARRKAAAAKLDEAVNNELPPLRLERAYFSTAIVTEPAASGVHGMDHVEFWVRTNPGTRPGPLMKVASVGELARFLLALKVVLADRGSAPTLVFDEVDAGVAGSVADAIGVRLARLSRRAQVIAVTHAPQVAARADRHYLIRKSALDQGKRVATRIAELAAEKRCEEIARMLAGAKITTEARAAAKRLMTTG